MLRSNNIVIWYSTDIPLFSQGEGSFYYNVWTFEFLQSKYLHCRNFYLYTFYNVNFDFTVQRFESNKEFQIKTSY